MSQELLQGHLYLVNLNPSKGTEAGKIRPCLVMQTNLLNQVEHPSTLVLPLTTQLLSEGNPLRFRLTARAQLHETSEVMLDQMRAIDNQRFCSAPIAKLTLAEFKAIYSACTQLIARF
jgi:mRNA interferase MazF